MKLAVIGGTGLIGSQVVKILNAGGHEAVPHSPSTGLDLLTGRGLPEVRAAVAEHWCARGRRRGSRYCRNPSRSGDVRERG